MKTRYMKPQVEVAEIEVEALMQVVSPVGPKPFSPAFGSGYADDKYEAI